MLGSIGKFLKDARGAFAMQFALMAIPLCVCTGLAIDGGRAFLAHYELASALDAAALAVGSTTDEDADLDAVAEKFVNMNFKTQHDDPIVLELTPGDDVILLKGSVKINTFFMPLVGQPHVTVSAESEVRRGGTNVEVALALDITGSMSGSKIVALKQAANDLIAEVVQDVQTPYFSKAALAPWGTNIHLGAYADAIRGPVTGPVSLTGAHWRDGSTKSIGANSGWRVGGVGLTITAATWRNGSAVSISGITKTNSNTRIRVQTSSAHGLANGDTVYISGANGSYTGLNGNKYKVADRTTTSPHYFWLQNIGTTTYTTPPAGSTNATTGSSQRCFDTECDVRITTSTAHTFAVGDRVRITGVSGMTQLNGNDGGASWQVETVPSTTTFVVENLNGPSTSTWTSGGTASECYTASCEYVINSTSHGFAAGDFINISGVTHVSGSTGTSLVTGNSSTFTIASVPNANSFILPGSGYSYRDWSSGGTLAECFVSDCKVRITTAAAHNLNAGDWTQITSISGPTGINNSATAAWQVAQVLSSTQFTLASTDAGLANTSSAYTANTGSMQCLGQGCQKYRYLTAAGSYAIDSISNCATERVGASAHTDDPPSTSYVGRDYPGGDGLVACNTTNNIVPLTSNKTTLTNAINAMAVNGSTAGQIGAEWGWYLVSPNWGYLWPADENRPKAYGTENLAKVMVFMTDGEFNTAHCNGVTTEDHAVGSLPSNDRIDSSVCTAADEPFDLAQATCTAMKAEGVIIYTVGFQLNLALGGDEFLAACATSPQHAYLASTNEELKENFKQIATSISKLRLSK